MAGLEHVARKWWAQRPKPGDRGTYHVPHCRGHPTGFIVQRIENNLCWARYDERSYGAGIDADHPQADCFIWCSSTGLNIFHDWPGKRVSAKAPRAEIVKAEQKAIVKGEG